MDVGVVPVETRTGGVYSKTNHEIDFVLNRGFRRVYLQSAFRMDDPEKRERELLPLLKGETRGIKKNPENIGIFACFRGKMNGGKGGSRTYPYYSKHTVFIGFYESMGMIWEFFVACN